MKAPLTSLLSTLIFSSILSSCNQTTGSNNGVKTNFSMTSSNEVAVASSGYEKMWNMIVPAAVALEPINLKDSGNRSVDLDQAWIVVKKIQFKTSALDDSSNDGTDSYHYKGPFFVDLLSNNPVNFGQITLPEQGIRRVKMLLHKATSGDRPSDAPSELLGKSIYLKGQVNGLNFSFAADDTTDFSISGSNAVVPEEGKDFLAVIRLVDLFKKIDLSDVTDGIQISASNRVTTSTNDPCPAIQSGAQDLYTCFKKGIAQEAKLGKDNGDKELNSSDDIVNE